MAIQIRRGTQAQWEAKKSNIVAGEPAIATDTGNVYVGTGSGTYTELAQKTAVDEVTDAVTLVTLDDGTDLNDVKAVGNYYMSGSRTFLNNPAVEGRSCVLYVTGTYLDGANSNVVQLLVEGSIGQMYIRVFNASSGTWGAWHSEIDYTLSVSGMAADSKTVGDAFSLNTVDNGADLNTVTKTGMYSLTSSRSYVNLPEGTAGHGCNLFVCGSFSGSGNSVCQVLIDRSICKYFIRLYSYTASEWSDWSVSLFNVLQSRFHGKKFSIIGDSVETFNRTGYKIPGYNMYYPRTGNDVDDVTKTWWDIVIINSGGSLDVNAAWSGSLASNRKASDGYPDFYDRVSLIGNPDVIFVALGSNDASHNVPLGEYDFTTAYASLSEDNFRTAYIKGIKALQATYPTADIICISEIMSDEYAESIEHIAKTLGCEYVDVRGYDASSDPNLRHPNAHGMRQIASWVMFPTDKHLWQSHYPADAKAVGAELKLLNDEIPNTVQNYTFTDGSVSKVEHTNGSDIIRTDTFTYATNTITETRTLNSGEVLTIVTNLTTLQTTVTYN